MDPCRGKKLHGSVKKLIVFYFQFLKEKDIKVLYEIFCLSICTNFFFCLITCSRKF